MRSYFRIRILQILRLLKELGVFRFLFIIGIAILLFSLCIRIISTYEISALILSLVLPVTIQFNRKDLLFIRTSFANANILLFIEYIFITLPILIITLLFAKHFIVFAFCIIIIFLVSNIFIIRIKEKRQKQIFNWHKHLISPNFFEWLSGLRKNPLFFIIYFIGLLLSFFPFVSVITMIICAFILSSFFLEPEPLSYILSYEIGEKKFIHYKIGRNLYKYLILMSPLFILGLLFNPGQYIMLCMVLLSCVIGFVAIIVSKYATYIPNHTSVGFNLISTLILTSIIFFPLMIITIPILLINYLGAIENLKKYLDDYN